MTVKLLTGPHSGERNLYEESLFTKTVGCTTVTPRSAIRSHTSR
jgi:hypothetical protein